VSARLIQEAKVLAARERLPAKFECRSIYELSAEEAGADLAVCCEVLEPDGLLLLASYRERNYAALPG
jgi:hypothetical protein